MERGRVNGPMSNWNAEEDGRRVKKHNQKFVLGLEQSDVLRLVKRVPSLSVRWGRASIGTDVKGGRVICSAS